MKFLTNHQNMTADELNREMVTFLTSACGHTFDENMPMTRENINWMTAVYVIDFQYAKTAEDLTNLLAALDKHYEGPINIHEGWGGCEADSNRDLITEKIRFDLAENWEGHSADATLSAIELGWYDADEYDERLRKAANVASLGKGNQADWNPDQDRLEIRYSEYEFGRSAVLIFSFGKTQRTRFVFQACACVLDESGQLFADLQRALTAMRHLQHGDELMCRYVRAWVKRQGAEFEPYNKHLAEEV